MKSRATTIQILTDFNASQLGARWSAALSAGGTQTVFQTRWWLENWWKCFGRGELLIVVAEVNSHLALIAPLFCDQGMVFFVGSGGTDYLDFVGDVSNVDVLTEILAAARDAAPQFLGFRFYHVPDRSRTGSLLKQAAHRLRLRCFDEGTLPAPALDLTDDPAAALAATRKKSLRRHERYFANQGKLVVAHTHRAKVIQPQLDAFFDQHLRRWEETASPSLFVDLQQREFYRCLTSSTDDTGYLRFTALWWNQLPIAFHFGFCYQGNYLWYKPSFEISLARRSPGEVLLRQLLLAAIDEGADVFDFGLGDEAFKRRFATRVEYVRTWGLYTAT